MAMNRETTLYLIIAVVVLCMWCMCSKTSFFTDPKSPMLIAANPNAPPATPTTKPTQMMVDPKVIAAAKADQQRANVKTVMGNTGPSDVVAKPKPSPNTNQEPVGMSPDEYLFADVDYTGAPMVSKDLGCALNSGVGLSSSLLPRKIGTPDQFGEFAPDDILKGQNFLNPRNQIGFPETIGGALRNGNQQLRAETPNPKMPYVWNNSTIVPDLMQKPLCT